VTSRNKRDRATASPPDAILAPVSSVALHSALTDRGEPELRALPAEASRLLTILDAPPRLAAHLRAVHDVAADMMDLLIVRAPELTFDRSAVLFGAATHDIGKIVHVNELTGPGSRHEPAGHALLIAHSVPEHLARFARTHGSWHDAEITVEDLLVSLADKIWKAKRVNELESLIVDRLSTAAGTEKWQAFLDLDAILEHLAADADRRLAFQASYPVRAS